MDITGPLWNLVFKIVGDSQLKDLREESASEKKVPALERGHPAMWSARQLLYQHLCEKLV
jgi:hypothetical protein